MMTTTQRRDVEREILQKREEFRKLHGDVVPTKLFLNRTLYLEFIMDSEVSKELNGARAYLGMTVYQASPLFGNPNDRVIEVA